MEISVLFVAGVALGAVLGATLGALALALWMRGNLARVERDKAVAEARLASSEEAAAKIGETFQAWPMRRCARARARSWKRPKERSKRSAPKLPATLPSGRPPSKA